MNRKALALALPIVILFSSLFCEIAIQPVKSQPSVAIFINADGNIEGTDKIQQDGKTYTVMGDLFNSSIEVQCDNIIIDGSGFTLQGPKPSSGIGVDGRHNVTVRNFSIMGGACGINLTSSSGNTISQNRIISSGCGIYLGHSGNNTILKNEVTGNKDGIRLEGRSIGNSLIENDIVGNMVHGLILEISSFNNILRKNRFVYNLYNFYTTMNFNLEEWVNDIDTSNVIGPDKKPMYYWINRHDEIVPQDAGYVALIECTNITVENQVFADIGSGVLLVHTSNSRIVGNKMLSCNLGAFLWHSSDNVIANNEFHSNMNDLFLSYSENNIISENLFNSQNGIYKQSHIYISSSSNNKIYCNNFYFADCDLTPAPQQILTYNSVNVWDDGYPSVGNYWSDYNGTDANSDGIGDTPYFVNVNNQDRYPLMNPIGSPQPPTPSYQPIAVWNQTYGTACAESATSMIQTNDGGYLLVGSTNASGNNDIWIVKTNPDGCMQWNQTYGGTLEEYAYGAVQTVDGGYAIGGYVRNGTTFPFLSSTDAYLVKTDASGNLQWSQTYGGLKSDDVNSVIQTSDGGYIMGGSTSSFGTGNSDFWLVKVDSSGNAQWNQTYGGINGGNVMCVIQTDDRGYALVGASGGDGWLIKTDAYGDVQWEQAYDGNDLELFASVVQADDGGYVLSGVTLSFDAGNADMYVVKTDRYGNVQWNETYGGASLDGGFSVIQNSYGEYVVVGFTSSSGLGGNDAVLVRFDPNGNIISSRTFGGPEMDLGRSVVQTSDGDYVFGGYTASFGAGDYDFWLVKTSEICSITTDDYDGLWHNSDFTITLTVTDSSGRSEIYYRINGGSIQTVDLNGQPYFTLECCTNTLEYWTVDGVGNEELPHKLLTEIKLDKTAPTGSIIINSGESSTASTSVTLTLTAADATSNIYQIRFSNDGIWDTEQWEAPASIKTWTLTSGDGIKTVYYQIMDNAGLVSITYSDTITLTSPPTDSGDSGTSSGSGSSSGTTPSLTPSPSPAPTPTLRPSPQPTESAMPSPPEERPLFLIATGVGAIFAAIGASMFMLKRRR
jgi:parallel beta-helix repeat protein